MRTIYCDEAGFTGNRLWDDDQPFFTYASIEIDPDDAADYIKSLRRRYRVDSNELKGGALCRKARGHAIVKQVLEDHSQRARVIVFEKKYALACKMFEYLFEPPLASISMVLYEIEFHKFIANGLYLEMLTGNSGAEKAFLRFQDALRLRTDDSLGALEGVIGPVSECSFLDHVLTFLICNRSAVASEVVDDLPSTVRSWMLELTTTGLHSLLAAHGEDMQPMEVYCDASKPLADQREFFSAMVGRTDARRIQFAGREHQFTYNLARPIQLVESCDTEGVQLADVFASASAFALKNQSSELASAWRDSSDQFLHGNSVHPEPECFDFSDAKCAVNSIVFHNLIEMTVRGADYLEILPRFVPDVIAAVEADPERFLDLKETA